MALAGTDVIELDDLPPRVRGEYATTLMPSLERRDTMRAWGSRYARLPLERCQGNKREACRVLDISYHTLQAYLRYPAVNPAGEADGAWPPGEGVDPADVPEAADSTCVPTAEA